MKLFSKLFRSERHNPNIIINSPIDVIDEFSKTKALYEDFKESSGSVFSTYGLDQDNIEPSNEIAYYEWESNELYKISETFKEEYYSYIKNNLHFYGCPIKLYKIHYFKRMYDFIEKHGLDEEKSFIEMELKRGTHRFNFNFLEDELQYVIDEALKQRLTFLANQLKQYNLEIIDVSSEQGFLLVESKSNSQETTTEELDDLPDEIGVTNIKERVLYLNETGVLKYLKNFDLATRSSTKKLAELLAYIIGIKSSTIQSYINPIINKREIIDQKNNPYTNAINVTKVRHNLTEKIGITLHEEYKEHF